MVNSEMSLPLKSTCLKINLKKIIFLGGILVLGIILFSFITKNCAIDYMVIFNDVQSLERSFDPEFCEYTVEKIDIFNDKCESEIEILDCG